MFSVEHNTLTHTEDFMEQATKFLTEYAIGLNFGLSKREAFNAAFDEIDGDFNNRQQVEQAKAWIKMFMEQV